MSNNELTSFNFEITSLQQAMDYAKLIADSDLAPKDYKGKPGNVLIAIQCGMEIGLKPMQAIQNIAIINGRPAVWGDAMLGLVQNSPLCESIKEYVLDKKAFCTVKRKGDVEEYTYSFSLEQAKIANLTGKPGPWTQYPERMLQMRARGFALRDKFSDVLKGIAMKEEVEDYEILPAREERQQRAKSTLSALIEGKGQCVSITVDDIVDMIVNAKNLDDLIPAAKFAKDLPEAEKLLLRQLYTTKELELQKEIKE